MRRKRGPRSVTRWLASSVVAVLLIGSSALAGALPASAIPMYELAGRWADGTPNEVGPGQAVMSEWLLNVNDDAAAPSNDPVDDVTLIVTATNGEFTSIPDGCLIDGVTPQSSISADGTVLTCNVGTRDMGTAVIVQVPVVSDGTTGDQVSLSGVIAGQGQPTGPDLLPIVGKYGMDITWQSPTSFTRWLNDDSIIRMDYLWTLNLLKGSEAGPNTVSYTITLDSTVGGTASVVACQPFVSDMLSGHPWSTTGKPTEQTAPYVDTCTLTPTGTPNTFTMTLTGIDYSQTQVPTMDSAGNLLPVDRVAVASGRIVFDLPATSGGSLSLTSSTPTYTSVSGATSIDDPSNNTVSKAFQRPGAWASTFYRAHTGSGGTNWDYSYWAAQGATITAGNHSELHRNDVNFGQTFQQCTVLDTAFVTYAESSPTWPPYQDITGTGNFLGLDVAIDSPELFMDDDFVHTMWYYVGDNATVTPGSGSYNPGVFAANCDVDPAGWTTTRPTELSTIKAVRTSYQVDARLLEFTGIVMMTYQTIKPTAPVGQDIWQFSSFKIGGGAWFYSSANAMTSTPGARYPYTTGYRDVVRVAGVAPYLEKSVDRSSVQIGEAAVYTIGYAANGGSAAPPTADEFVIVDTLPIGMEYVTGTATVGEPVVTIDGSGRQVLTWTLDGVPTNQLNALTYQALATSAATAGETLTNSARASVGGLDSATALAQVSVSAAGATTVGKTADQAYIPNIAGDGVGGGAWTVTLRSFDPAVQDFTDTIDILPYNGDGRGTSFTGTYAVTGVTAVAGAIVYYTDADPSSLSDDPADPMNGAAGSIAGNTVGWSTTMPPNATAVRVIGPALGPAATQSFNVAILTDGASGGDVLVNRAHARAEHTELSMLTSAPTTVANYYSASLKKYVRDADGEWHDANTVEDYPRYFGGDSVPYRIVVTNTGQGTLTNIVVDDDRYPAEGGFTVPTLAPGGFATHEFTIALATDAIGTLVNTATASADLPSDTGVPPTINIDPAGIEISTKHQLQVEKLGEATDGSWVRMAGAGFAVHSDETGAVGDELTSPVFVEVGTGLFQMDELPAGTYWLVETEAPEGFSLLAEPVQFGIGPDGITILAGGAETVSVDGITITVRDVPAMELPETGGSGTVAFSAVGALILAAAIVAALVLRRRRPTTREEAAGTNERS